MTAHPVIAAPPGIPWNDRGIRFTVALRTKSEMNQRDHPMAVHRRKTAQHASIKLHMLVHMRACRPEPPYVVTMTRIASRSLDTDNLASSFKFIRDQIAKSLGISDGPSESHEWVPLQRKPRPKEPGLALGFGVEVRIDARAM